MTKNTKPILPPVLTRDDFDSLAEYEEYIAFESEGFQANPATSQQKKKVAQIAKSTIEKITGDRVPIGLRLPARDVQRVKALALRKGLPYQTLIGAVLHQYLDGELVER